MKKILIALICATITIAISVGISLVFVFLINIFKTVGAYLCMGIVFVITVLIIYYKLDE